MKIENIFLVFDPTRDEQPALDRLRAVAAELSTGVHIYACIHADLEGQQDAETSISNRLTAQWHLLEAAATSLGEKGVAVTTEVEWQQDWYQAVVAAARKQQADLVLKSSYRHSAGERILNKTSDWALIRECECPVLLVKEGDGRNFRKVLAAIDIRSEKVHYEKLNQQIIGFTRKITESESAEVHFINAHKDLSSTPDRNALARACGVGSDRVHVRLGKPEDVIVENARDLDVGLVVIGNSARSGLSAVFNSNTAEKVLDRLECDLLSMP